MKKIIFKILFSIVILSPHLKAQKYVPTAENLEAREWFQNARFGLFRSPKFLIQGQLLRNLRQFYTNFVELATNLAPTWVNLG